MDFELPEELKLLKDNLRKFVDKELIPLERDVVNDIKLQKELPKKLRPKAEALGLWQYDVPEEFGGLGLGMMAKVIVWSEISRTTALPSRSVNIFGFPVSPILYTLEGRAKEEYLLPVINGEKTSCFAQTEADAGSDPAAMRTNAVRDGDDYVINGVKRFITGADEADFTQVFAVTDPEKRARGGITGFLVDMDTPGVKVTASYDLMVDDKPCEIVFDNVRVPAWKRIGKEGDGFRAAQSWLNSGRMRHGARSLGVMERCFELGSAYAKQRKTFGAYLADRQSVQWPLTEIYMDMHKLRLMLYHAAWREERGEDARQEAFMVKIFGDERSFWAADRVMQIHGGMGLSKELPIERFFRDQRSMMITEGAVEVLRMALARMILNVR
jgi:acyl-CoA dehydrogenase